MGLRPHRRYTSCHDEIMQLTLVPGEWIQVCLSIGTREEPKYEIIQLAVMEDGRTELRGNLPIVPWGTHEAVREESDHA